MRHTTIASNLTKLLPIAKSGIIKHTKQTIKVGKSKGVLEQFLLEQKLTQRYATFQLTYDRYIIRWNNSRISKRQAFLIPNDLEKGDWLKFVQECIDDPKLCGEK